jgi:hypothetical protein
MNIKVIATIAVVLNITLLTIGPSAKATHISATSCTNSCVTTINSEANTVETRDCCGGRVTTTIYTHEKAPGRDG